MRSITSFIVGLSLFALSACSQKDVQSPEGNSSNSSVPKVLTRSVKVLNRVSCHASQSECPQSLIDQIWKICIRNGYQEKPSLTNILSSREIRELVNEVDSVTKKKLTYKYEEDEMGIVARVPVTKLVTVEKTTKGYCIGSEYIQQVD